MPLQKNTGHSEKPAIKDKIVPPLKSEKLAELACLLSKNESDEPNRLVKRALEIWRAANDELSGIQQYQASEAVSFEEIAVKEMLQSSRASYEFVGSSKGVGKTVDRYFKALLNKYDHVMQGRQIDAQMQKAIKQQIEKLWKIILAEKKMPKRVLDLLEQFQIDIRKQSHEFSASEIHELLRGFDIGTPSSDL